MKESVPRTFYKVHSSKRFGRESGVQYEFRPELRMKGKVDLSGI